jgi:hypothetical protein
VCCAPRSLPIVLFYPIGILFLALQGSIAVIFVFS